MKFLGSTTSLQHIDDSITIKDNACDLHCDALTHSLGLASNSTSLILSHFSRHPYVKLLVDKPDFHA